jgi:phage baseplate assembly protein W
MSTDNSKLAYTSFLGSGWSFPPSFNAKTNSVAMTTDEADIEASLRILLGTTAGERMLHPTYGLNLQELLFEPMTTTMQTLFKDRVKTTILIYEPRIEVLSIDLDSSVLVEGKLLLKLDYAIRSTNSRFNLVYPFYLNDGNEVSASIGA